ncbi:MAG: MFS transporter [Ardenticatenaceae bacterium]|nr:MFS transporter [Ardenticatenaceae bacterium]MCB9004105.1 MFS transporter [Ardenticatenaceae bacterium]
MKAFTVIWFGQMVSMLGTGMTNFAVSFWIFQETGQATALTWAIFFFIAPSVFLSPFAGAIVDRSNRKTIMILSDLAAGFATIFLLTMLALGNLQIWHVYVANVLAGAFNSFQFPAYSAAVTLMLPKKHYGRASGMISLAGSASNILAPAFAGALLGPIGLVGIMSIDVVTFVFAIATLFVVFIPQPEVSAEGQMGRGNLWQESGYGFRYIFQRPSLFGLQLVFFAINFIAMFGFSLMVPMILARTGNNEVTLASVQSLGAVGGVLGGLLLSAWGGPKRKVHGVLVGMMLVSLLGQAVMGLGQGLFLWAAGAFAVQFFLPILNGSNQAIWQAKVAPDVQGRVFAVRRLIAQVTAPIATALAGPFADRLFEPALREGGALVDTFGWLVGTGPGAGMSLMFVLTGVLGALVGLSGYLFPAVRNAEDILPDHDSLPQSPVEASEAEGELLETAV